jgi:hypothetical protein
MTVLEVSPDGTLWVAGPDAIARHNGTEWETVWGEHGLGAINDMAFVSDGSIWLGTDRGAHHFMVSPSVPLSAGSEG